MANVEEMDCFALDQAFWEWWMGVGPFMDNEGFIFQPQPYQPQPEALLMYNATTHSNALTFADLGQGGLRCNLGLISEGQFSSPGCANLTPYDVVQYGEAPACSAMTAVLRVNNNPSSTYNPQVLPSTSSTKNNKRKFKDHVGCFSIRKDAAEHKRKRQAFDPKTRQEVALMRRLGPCTRCSIKKVKVSDLPRIEQAMHLMIASANFQAHA